MIFLLLDLYFLYTIILSKDYYYYYSKVIFSLFFMEGITIVGILFLNTKILLFMYPKILVRS